MAINQSTIDKYLGKVFPTNRSGDVVVIEVLERSHCLIKFLDTGNIREVANKTLLNGNIKDSGQPYRKAVATTSTKEYRAWRAMMQRCSNDIVKKNNPTYENCSTSENFKSFDFFKEWYNDQIGCDQNGWHLDKDLLIKGNKVYSEDVCVLVPHEINTLITGANSIRGALPKGVYLDKHKSGKGSYRARVSQNGKRVCYGSYENIKDAWLAYKKAKESWVKVVANKWKDKIDPRVYEALMTYQVEFED